VLVNAKSVNVPSYVVEQGDVVEINGKAKANVEVQAAMASAQARIIPEWLSLDKENAKGMIKALPNREQMPQGINEQLVVELYSR
jgi:small subunit ribosomal protein S4